MKEIILAANKINTVITTEITGAEKSKLFPTDLAMIVTDFLVQYFPTITDYSFTANVEKEFDEIAEGKKKWEKMLAEFYSPFHETVLSTTQIERSSISSSKELGVHPQTGEKIIARLGRFGPIVQVGEADEETGKKPQFASLRKGQFIENITLEDALELFKLPREAGEYEGKVMKVAIGRFGPYILHDSKFYSISKEDDPLVVTEQRCIEIIEAKRKAEAEKLIKEFPENADVKVLNGRWGPYIVAGNKNVKIPKGKDPQSLTLAECLELAENAPEKKGRFAKKTASKTPEKKAPVKKTPVKKIGTTAKKTTVKKAASAKAKTTPAKPKPTKAKTSAAKAQAEKNKK